MIAWAFCGGIIGLAVGLVIARMLAAYGTTSGLRSVATSCGGILALSLLALGTSRYFAHIPPTIDGQRLTLQIELRLPPRDAKPAAPKKEDQNAFHETVTSSFYRSRRQAEMRARNAAGQHVLALFRAHDMSRYAAP